LPGAFLDTLSIEDREAMWRRNLEAIAEGNSSSCLLVAEGAAGEIVGFASAGHEREKDSPFEGELYAIYLFQEHQGMGIGSRLFLHAVQHLRSIGCMSLRVWVLRGNPAKGFYERFGGVPAGEKTITIGGEERLETAYGWNDLAKINVISDEPSAGLASKPAPAGEGSP
jgi:GNAT superfamily N-acetyltransferase